MKKMLNKNLAISIMSFSAMVLVASGSSAFAKIKPATPTKPKSLEIGFIKGINGEASLTVLKNIPVSPETGLVQFQDGKLAEDIEFYKSPRCYLHFKKEAENTKELTSGKILKVSKIDNVYNKGSVHVTFWFDDDANVSDLACITNYNHTLTTTELRSTLGSHFSVVLTKSVETGALFNTAPINNAPVLQEDQNASNTQAARVILQGS